MEIASINTFKKIGTEGMISGDLPPVGRVNRKIDNSHSEEVRAEFLREDNEKN